MSIVTQCPSCGTKFRVTPPQLQAQHGMVRCGRCAQVFDGFKTLATLPDTPPADLTPAVVEPAPVAAAKPKKTREPMGTALPATPVAATPVKTPETAPPTPSASA